MKTTSNGVQIPDNGTTSSNDKYGDIVNAIVNNANILDAIFGVHGQLVPTQSDYSEGYWISSDKTFMIQWGHPAGVAMGANKEQAGGTITFPKSFTHSCLGVIGSDAGVRGMSFGFYGRTVNGCTWCTAEGLGYANAVYSPTYVAFGW